LTWFLFCPSRASKEADVDWALAIKINQSALGRIMAALIAMVGLTAQDAVPRLPRPVYRAALAILRPAESALRRLIIVAARGVVITPHAVRPLPAGVTLPARGDARAPASFQLFDARKRFARSGSRSASPRISSFGASPFVPLFKARVGNDAEPEPDDGLVDAARLGRRLRAVKLALENLPRQARRFRRWQARRERMTNPNFRSPLRPGPPPGYRKRPRDEVDLVLTECHALAWDALREDSS
jgi:hypothetical protein